MSVASVAGPDAASDAIWRAPLVPAAFALTAGIIADRYFRLPLGFTLLIALLGLVAWLFARRASSPATPLTYLAISLAMLGAAYHHIQREVYPADDIGNFAGPMPRIVRALGVLAEEPVIVQHRPDPLRSYTRPNSSHAVLRVTHLNRNDRWQGVSGKARLVVDDEMVGLHAGDEVEVIGFLVAPPTAANPGEFDYASFLADQRIRADLLVRKTAEGVTRTRESWPTTLSGWLAVTRGQGQRALSQELPQDSAGVAGALLLGEGSSMTTDDWQKYIRTGVIHVLAISGQHLVILAGFLWGLLRLFGVRRRRGAWIVALLLLAYALLAGGRPPVLRAAVMVCAACGGIILRRPTLSANSFALAWILVAALNPADIFSTGCQLSFLSVAIILWGTSRWLRRDVDQLDVLIDENRPVLVRCLMWIGRMVVYSYAVTAAIWLAVAPLVAARNHLVSPVALILSPPMILLTTIALLSGFLLLLASMICWPLAPLFAWSTRLSLAGCDLLVNAGDRMPFYFYVGDIPEWWLWVFYLTLLAFLTLNALQIRRRAFTLAGIAWVCVGLAGAVQRPADDGLRCTFLAVGHGGCVVIETPEGRTLLYDAGSLGGPDVTRRQIAPFLWQRGIRRIDEVFLSHADLDHFNGLPALLERFAVGQVTCTPSFADRSTTGVSVTLDALRKQGIATRIISAGDRLTSGSVTIDVLHPPAVGPEGKENVRSMVLLLQHAGHSILLTGDLELTGQDRVLSLPPMSVDVLMAPHHGSRTANTPELALWASPRVVVSCEGIPRGRRTEPYSDIGARFLSTLWHGAVTIRSREESLTVQTFRQDKSDRQ